MSRDPRWEEAKFHLLSLGSVLALIGLVLDDRRVTGLALGVLSAGLVLRLASGRRRDALDYESDDGFESGSAVKLGEGSETTSDGCVEDGAEQRP